MRRNCRLARLNICQFPPDVSSEAEREARDENRNFTRCAFFRDTILGAETPASCVTKTRIRRSAQRFLTLALFLIAITSTMNAESLDELRWKKRVIIIYAPAGSKAQLARQEQLLRSRSADLKERDITQIVLRSRAENPKIADRFKLTGTDFALLLIGKDGGEKLRSHKLVSPEAICRLIDSMPMRQEEMRKRGR